MENGIKHPVRETSSGISAELRMEFEMADAFMILKNFSTPNSVIVSIAKTIADDGCEIIEIVFGGGREGMGAMVLDRDERDAKFLSEFFSVYRCLILWMRVTENHFWFDMCVGEKAFECCLVSCEGSGMSKITEVLRENDATTSIKERESVVHLSAKSKNWCGDRRVDSDGFWDKTTAPSNEEGGFADDFDDGVIGCVDDFAIMIEYQWDELFCFLGGERSVSKVRRSAD